MFLLWASSDENSSWLHEVVSEDEGDHIENYKERGLNSSPRAMSDIDIYYIGDMVLVEKIISNYRSRANAEEENTYRLSSCLEPSTAVSTQRGGEERRSYCCCSQWPLCSDSFREQTRPLQWKWQWQCEDRDDSAPLVRSSLSGPVTRSPQSSPPSRLRSWGRPCL